LLSQCAPRQNDYRFIVFSVQIIPHNFRNFYRCPPWFGLHFGTKNDMRTFLRDQPFSLASPVQCMEIFSCPRLAIILIESVTEKIWSCFASASYDANSEAYSRICTDCILTAAKLVIRLDSLSPERSHRCKVCEELTLRLARGLVLCPRPPKPILPQDMHMDMICINSSSQPSFYITIGSYFQFLLYWNPQIPDVENVYIILLGTESHHK